MKTKNEISNQNKGEGNKAVSGEIVSVSWWKRLRKFCLEKRNRDRVKKIKNLKT